MPFCILMRERKGVDLEGHGNEEDLGEAEGEETVIRIYCVKKNLFSMKKKTSIKIK